MECLKRIVGEKLSVHHNGDKYLTVYVPAKLKLDDLEEIYKKDKLLCFHFTRTNEMFGGNFEYTFTKP